MWESPLDFMRGHSVSDPFPKHGNGTPHGTHPLPRNSAQCQQACLGRAPFPHLSILNCILELNSSKTRVKISTFCVWRFPSGLARKSRLVVYWLVVHFVSLEPRSLVRILFCIGVVPSRSFSCTHGHRCYMLCIETELWLPPARERTSMNMCVWCLCPLLLPPAPCSAQCVCGIRHPVLHLRSVNWCYLNSRMPKDA